MLQHALFLLLFVGLRLPWSEKDALGSVGEASEDGVVREARKGEKKGRRQKEGSMWKDQ